MNERRAAVEAGRTSHYTAFYRTGNMIEPWLVVLLVVPELLPRRTEDKIVVCVYVADTNCRKAL